MKLINLNDFFLLLNRVADTNKSLLDMTFILKMIIKLIDHAEITEKIIRK